MRSRDPSSTPAGILTVSFFVLLVTPLPRHSEQGTSGTLPVPSHSSQAVTEATWPKIVLREVFICPVPWHFGQALILLPGSAPSPLHRSQTSRFSSEMF